MRAVGSGSDDRTPPAVEDVNVTFEDQQKINKFARNTSRMTELKSEIDAKKVSVVIQGSQSGRRSDHHNVVWEQ
ncbi:hypothetical protein INR49_006779 [Caranx melampygus]|nr:hypothetical protein INR49_006779 [Caranx melampygus]